MFLCSALFIQLSVFSQSETSKIDYSIHSNVLDPDTLCGDQQSVFQHFIKLSSKDVEEMPPLKVKEEFIKLGITLLEKDRFREAWDFLDLIILFHKKDVELWQSFKDLAPKSD